MDELDRSLARLRKTVVEAGARARAERRDPAAGPENGGSPSRVALRRPASANGATRPGTPPGTTRVAAGTMAPVVPDVPVATRVWVVIRLPILAVLTAILIGLLVP